MISLLVMSALFCTCPLSAQTTKASISGSVTDATGAVIAGAKISVKDLDRGLVYTNTSNAAGFYLLPELPPGNYSLTAGATGFRTYIRDNFPLQTQQRATADIALQVGAMADKVEVTGSAQLLEANSATISNVVENKKIVDLPLNGRNIYSLLRLSPGVAPSTPNGDTDFFTGAHRYSINGGRESTTDIQLDGISTLVQSDISGIYATSTEPSVESVEEFRVQTNAFSAEYGRSGGGLVTMVTKSGTNEFHGSLFHFFRNSKLDSNSWQANKAGSALPSLQRNQFGGSIGGPIIKNKTFFFFTYDGTRINQSAFGQWTVPTALERTGDFSKTLNTAGGIRQIYDPFSTIANTARPGFFVRTPLAGNIIPASRIDPAAIVLSKYWPTANQPGQAITNALNLGIRASVVSPIDRYDVKVDHNFTSKQRLFARYDRLSSTSGDYDYWKNLATPANGTMIWGSHNAGLDYTNTLTSSTVFNGRLGMNRFDAFRPSFNLGFDVSKELGWSPEVSRIIAATGVPMFPAITTQDVATIGGIQGPYYTSGNTQFMGIANLSHVAGRHTTKVGFEGRLFYLGFSQLNGMPTMAFSRTMTQGPDPRSPSESGGYGYASFLFGTPDSGSIAHAARTYNQSKYWGAYIQDDFKVNKKLTLNLGLRMEVSTGNVERFNRMSVNDPTVKNPVSDKVGFPVYGGYDFAGSTLGRNAIVNPQYNYSPRFGIAYQFNEKTTIRTGYGVFFGIAPFAATTKYVGGAFSSSTAMIASLDGITPKDTLRNPFPTLTWNLPTGTSLGLLTAIGQNLNSGTPSDLRVPYNQQWNLSIQRQLSGSTLFEVAYTGNKGTRLNMETWYNQNQLNPSQVSASNDLLTLVPNPFAGIVTSGTLAQPTVQRGQLMRPYPLWQTVQSSNAGWGNSDYHALQGRLERRFSRGASLGAAFTWSKIISDSSDGRWNDATGAFGGFRNAYCRTCERGLSSYDVPKRLVVNYTYELPFGKGKTFGSSWNRAIDTVLGGWQANGILTLASGQPIVVTQSSNTSNSFGGKQNPNSTGANADLGSARTVAKWFDYTQYSVAPAYTFGNVGRTTNIRADYTHGMDFSLFKTANVFRERVKVQFRAEAFNISNTPVFAAPNANIQAATVGQVTSQANSPRQVQLSLKLLF